MRVENDHCTGTLILTRLAYVHRNIAGRSDDRNELYAIMNSYTVHAA